MWAAVTQQQGVVAPQPSSRLVRINLTSEFGEDGPTGWNNIKANSTAVSTPNGIDLPDLLDSDGEATGWGFTNQTAFDGANNNFSGTYGEPNGIYPHTVVNSGWQFVRDRGDTLRIYGLDDNKKYNVYIGSYQNDSVDYSVAFTINGDLQSKSNFETYGDESDTEPISNYLVGALDIIPSSGNIDIVCNSVGFFQGKFGCVLVYEQGAPPEPPVESVKITVSMSDASDADSAIPELKFNKQGAIVVDFDDSALCSLDSESKMSSVSYTDGAGNNIPYTAGVALNGRFQFDNEWVGGPISNARNSITYEQQKQLLDAGWDLMNHSFYHDPDGNQTGDPRWGYGNDPERNVRELSERILDVQGYRFNGGVVPNADAGFQTEFDSQGMLVGSSQGTFDGYPVWDQFHWPKRLSLLPNDWNFIVQHRDFNQSGMTNEGVFWARVDDLIAYMDSNPTARCMVAMGTHDLSETEQTNYNAWIDDIVSRAGDRVLVVGLTQFWEYQRLRRISKIDTVVGNSLEINLDYSSIPNINNYSWYDLSFIVGGTGNINGVSCNDSRFNVSFNPTTRLVNIKYRKTEWTP